MHRLSCAQALYQILPKSDESRQSYSKLNITNFGAVRHLEFEHEWILSIPPLRRTHRAFMYRIRQPVAELLVIRPMARFSGSNTLRANSYCTEDRITPHLRRTCSLSKPKHLKWNWVVVNRGQSSYFFTPRKKLEEKWAKYSNFQVQPMSQPVIYSWRGGGGAVRGLRESTHLPGHTDPGLTDRWTYGQTFW